MKKFVFYVGAFHSLLVWQAERWKSTINKPLRFFLYWASSLYAAAIVLHLSKLPDGSIEHIAENIFNPIYLLLAVVIAIYSLAGAYAVVVAGKIKASL